MYRTELIDLSICPRRDPPIRSLASVWAVVAPALREEGSCIQISGKYILSLGAHFTHAYALLSKIHRIDYLTAVEICNSLSFLFDTPIDVGMSFRDADAQKALRGVRRFLKLKGINVTDLGDLQKSLAERVEWIALASDDFQRLLPIAPANNGKFLALDLPKSQSVTNALVAYRQALLSVDPAGEILNYWRVLEATTSGPADRTMLLDRLFQTRMLPVFGYHRYALGNRREVNLVSRYNRAAKRHFERLRHLHGSTAGVMQFLYKKRRCPSAHATTDVLRADPATQLKDLFADALLLKCLARLAIQDRY